MFKWGGSGSPPGRLQGAEAVFNFSINQTSVQESLDQQPNGNIPMSVGVLSPGKGGSPFRGHTMREYDEQISHLQKENFNLKLRIFLWEERLGQKHLDVDKEELLKQNVELEVRAKTLECELDDKKLLLREASQAVDTMEIHCNQRVAKFQAEHQLEKGSLEACIEDLQKRLKDEQDKSKYSRTPIGIEGDSGLLPETCSSLVGAANVFCMEHVSSEQMLHMNRKVGELEQETFHLKQQLEKCKVQLDKTYQQLDQTMHEIHQKDLKIQELGKEVAEHQTQVSELDCTVNKKEEVEKQLRVQLEEKEEEIASMTQQVDSTTRLAEQLTREVRRRDIQLEELGQELEVQREEVDKRDNRIQALESDLAFIDGDGDMKGNERDRLLEAKQSELEQQNKILVEIQITLDEKQKQIDELKSQLMEREERIRQLDRQLEEAKQRNCKYEGSLKTKDKEMDELRNRLHQREDNIRDLSSRLDTLTLQLDMLRQQAKLPCQKEDKGAEGTGDGLEKNVSSKKRCESGEKPVQRQQQSEEELQKEVLHLNEKCKMLDTAYKKACHSIKGFVERIRKLEKEIEKLQADVRRKERKILDLNGQLSEVQERANRAEWAASSQSSGLDDVHEMAEEENERLWAELEEKNKKLAALTEEREQLLQENQKKTQAIMDALKEKECVLDEYKQQVLELKSDHQMNIGYKDNHIAELEKEVKNFQQTLQEVSVTTVAIAAGGEGPRGNTQEEVKKDVTDKLNKELRKKNADFTDIVNQKQREQNHDLEKLSACAVEKEVEVQKLRTEIYQKNQEIQLLQGKLQLQIQAQTVLTSNPNLISTATSTPNSSNNSSVSFIHNVSHIHNTNNDQKLDHQEIHPDIIILKQEVQSLQARLQTSTAERKFLGGKLEELHQRLRNTPDRENAQMQVLRDELKKTKQQREQEKEKLQEKEKELEQHKAEMKGLKRKLQKMQLPDDIMETLRKHQEGVRKYKHQVVALKKKLADSTNACDLLRGRLEELADFLEELLRLDEQGVLDLSHLTPQRRQALQNTVEQSRELSRSLSQSLICTLESALAEDGGSGGNGGPLLSSTSVSSFSLERSAANTESEPSMSLSALSLPDEEEVRVEEREKEEMDVTLTRGGGGDDFPKRRMKEMQEELGRQEALLRARAIQVEKMQGLLEDKQRIGMEQEECIDRLQKQIDSLQEELRQNEAKLAQIVSEDVKGNPAGNQRGSTMSFVSSESILTVIPGKRAAPATRTTSLQTLISEAASPSGEVEPPPVAMAANSSVGSLTFYNSHFSPIKRASRSLVQSMESSCRKELIAAETRDEKEFSQGNVGSLWTNAWHLQHGAEGGDREILATPLEPEQQRRSPSESEAWSEPDRQVSLARIGLHKEALLSSKDKARLHHSKSLLLLSSDSEANDDVRGITPVKRPRGDAGEVRKRQLRLRNVEQSITNLQAKQATDQANIVDLPSAFQSALPVSVHLSSPTQTKAINTSFPNLLETIDRSTSMERDIGTSSGGIIWVPQTILEVIKREDLIHFKETLDSVLSRLTNETTRNEVGDLAKQLQDTMMKLAEETLRSRQLQEKLKEANRLLEETQHKFEALFQEKAQSSAKEQGEVTAKLSEALENVDHYQIKLEEKEARIRQLEESQVSLEAERERLLQELAQQTQKTSTSLEERTHLETRLDALELSRSQTETQAAELRIENSQLKDRIAGLEEEVARLEVKYKGCRVKVQLYEMSLRRLGKENENLEHEYGLRIPRDQLWSFTQTSSSNSQPRSEADSLDSAAWTSDPMPLSSKEKAELEIFLLQEAPTSPRESKNKPCITFSHSTDAQERRSRPTVLPFTLRRQKSEMSDYISDQAAEEGDIEEGIGAAAPSSGEAVISPSSVRNVYSSPDLGIESDPGRFSSWEQNPAEISPTSMSSLGHLIPLTDASQGRGDESTSKQLEEQCRKNASLKRKLNRAKEALQSTLEKLKESNKRKERVEAAISRQLHKTHNILREARHDVERAGQHLSPLPSPNKT